MWRRGGSVHSLGSLEWMDRSFHPECRRLALREPFHVPLHSPHAGLTSLLDSMWSGSTPSSPGPEASFEVKGPEGSTGLGGSDNTSQHPPHPLCHGHREVPMERTDECR